MDENQILPNKNGVEQKALTNGTLKQYICKTVNYGKSTIDLCVSVTSESLLHRNKGFT